MWVVGEHVKSVEPSRAFHARRANPLPSPLIDAGGKCKHCKEFFSELKRVTG